MKNLRKIIKEVIDEIEDEQQIKNAISAMQSGNYDEAKEIVFILKDDTDDYIKKNIPSIKNPIKAAMFNQYSTLFDKWDSLSDKKIIDKNFLYV